MEDNLEVDQMEIDKMIEEQINNYSDNTEEEPIELIDRLDNCNLKEVYKFVSNCNKCGKEFGHDAKVTNGLCPICDQGELIKFKKNDKNLKPKDLNSTVSNDFIMGEQ